MKNKKIFIIAIILILMIVVGITIYLIPKDNKQKDVIDVNKEENIQEVITNLLKNVNEINKVFTEDSSTDKGNYTNEMNYYCVKYNQDNQEKIINKLYEIYANPFLDASYFELSQREVNDKTEDILYICQPSDCQIKEIDIDEFEVINQTEDEILVQIGNGEYFITKDDSKWKFTFPLVICEK